MGEIFDGESKVTATIIELPRYTTSEFDKLVELTPEYYVDDGKVTGEAKKKLDSINVWWRQLDHTEEELNRIKKAPALPGVPQLESKQAGTIYEEAQHKSNQVIWGLDLALTASKPTWEKVEETAEYVDAYKKGKPFYNQSAALCEAVSDTRELGLTESQMRQIIAQHAWDELIRMIPYAKLDEFRETTRDDIETEKTELLEALNGPVWDEEDRKRAGIEFRKYKGQMKKNEFDPALRRKFKFLYEATKGNISPKKSAIDILRVQEEILEGLYDEDALTMDEEG